GDKTAPIRDPELAALLGVEPGARGCRSWSTRRVVVGAATEPLQLARQRGQGRQRVAPCREDLDADMVRTGVEVAAHGRGQRRRTTVRDELVDGGVGGAVVEVRRREPVGL